MAIRIVAAATLKLNVAMAVQSKRLHYIPVGRFLSGDSRRTDGIRSKALFSGLHLLQRLVYVESEPYERQKERAGTAGPPRIPAAGDPASDEDLLVYFIKHLVRITTKRNAFYVTLGVSRLLHNYSTVETMEIYNAVIGEPERVKDDYYYRSRKALLMHEMYQRFGQLIRACRHRRGEERFETQQGSSELRLLVGECLRLFTPWDTQCSVPHDFDPIKSVIAALTSKTSTDENEIEVNRIHAILHPDCFERLVLAVGYSPPAERMELPRFFSNQTNDQSPPRRRSAPTDLSAEEIAEISHLLDQQGERRRRSSPTAVIRIMVDGVEQARLNLAKQSSVSFSVDEDAEIIEVRTTDAHEDLLLATHLLTSFGKGTHDETIVSSVRLEGGQELSLSITRRKIEANEATDLLVKFGYRETDLRRAARLRWQRLSLRLNSEPSPRILWGDTRISARYILVGSAIIICLTSFLGYVTLRSRQTSGPPQISAAQTTPPGQDVSITNSPGAKATNPAGTGTPVNNRIVKQDKAASKANRSGPGRTSAQPAPQAKSDRANVRKIPSSSGAGAKAQTRDEDVAAGVMRSGNVVPNLKLGEVRKVCIEIRGDVASNELRSNLVERIGSSGVVAATDPDEADAALKIVVLQTSAGDIPGGRQIEVSALLVNARGAVLWPKENRGARRYSGETTKVLAEIVKDLLSEIGLARSGGPRQ